MIHDLLEFIKRMGIFLICAESILYFTPGNSYQKYIRVLIGFMLLMQFMIPVRAFLSGQERAIIESQVNEFRLQMENISNERNSSILNLPSREELVEKSIAEEIKSRLNNVLKVENKDFIVINVETGSITCVILKRHKWGSGQGESTNINIENIRIERIIIKQEINGDKEDDSFNDINQTEINEILNLFCRELRTDREYLEVKIVD